LVSPQFLCLLLPVSRKSLATIRYTSAITIILLKSNWSIGTMKNLQLLENCFADSGNIRDVAKMEAISSKLIRQNSRLQKEKDQLVLQARKQEVCISHLLKKLENAADLAKEQQTRFDEALHQQTETVTSMLKELCKSRSEIIKLQSELELQRAKSFSKGHETKVHRIPVGDDAEDFSDDITVRRRNNSDDITIRKTNNVVSHHQKEATLPYSMIQQEGQYRESVKDSLASSGPPARLMRYSSGDTELRMHRDRFRPDDDIEMISQPFTFDGKRIARSGLQEVDMEAPRPPLSRQSSGVRGSTQSPGRLPATSLNSRSFAMDAVRLSRSSRSLGAGL